MKDADRDGFAEMAIGAMISLISLILMAAVLAGVLLAIVEMTFAESKQTAVTQSDSLNGIIMVSTFELSQYSDPGNDRVYLVFEFPFITADLEDIDVVWSMLCDGGASVGHLAGDFDEATEILDSGSDAAANDFFEPSKMYHMYISTTGVCDLSPGVSAELVIAMEGGRVKTMPFSIGENPRVGDSFV